MGLLCIFLIERYTNLCVWQMFMARILALLLIMAVNGMCFASSPVPWQIGFQEPSSPLMEELHNFHNFLLIIISFIVLFVFFLLAYVIYRFNARRNPIPSKFTHNVVIEVIWTVIPTIILVIIAVPSFRILKMAEHSPPAEMTIKVIGSQWYWTYSYPDYGNFEFISNRIPDEDLKPGQKRLFEVDNRVIIPENTVVKFLITASDVLHSFAIPSLGIKMDAVPGRVNETWTQVKKRGVYYGQCSELCGILHGFMPIALEVVSREDFEKWLVYAKTEYASKENFIKNHYLVRN